MTTALNFHNNAAALIIAAAEKSGLLRDVASALHYQSISGNPPDCLACNVLEVLTDDFYTHCDFAGYDFGVCIPQYSDEELRPYLHVPFTLPRNPDARRAENEGDQATL